MKPETCIQIGLEHTTELLDWIDEPHTPPEPPESIQNFDEFATTDPLTLERIKALYAKKPKALFIPKEIRDIQDWQYIGVDVDIVSIAKHINIHSTRPNVHFVEAKIVADTNARDNQAYRLARHHSFMSGRKQDGKYPIFYTPEIPFSALIKECTRLFEVETIKILMMDIEGNEYGIFRNYNWHIKPQFLVIECHYFSLVPRTPENLHPHVKELIAFLAEKGYELIDVSPNNFASDGLKYIETYEIQLHLTTF